MGVFAEMLAATTDAVSGIYSYVSNNYVELQVLDWCKTMLGYPSTASGLLTSGCSASNLIALAVARNAKAGFDLRREGMSGAALTPAQQQELNALHALVLNRSANAEISEP